jgi:hypothetical protein
MGSMVSYGHLGVLGTLFGTRVLMVRLACTKGF